MSSEPEEEKKIDDSQYTKPPTIDDDDSDDDHSYVSEPDEAQKRYAALRNHQIRFSDAIDPNAERVYQVKEIDIVLGRGRGFQNHSGNRRMRLIIENFKNRYHSMNRIEKRKMVKEVYDKISEGGARFLKKLDNEEAWVVVDLPVALQKVSHTMRCRKSIHKRLDAHGLVPQGVGGPQPELHPHTGMPMLSTSFAPQRMGPLGATHLGGIPRIVSTGTARDHPLGVVPPSAFAAMAGVPSAIAPRPMALGAGLYPTTPGLSSLVDLEAQHFAAHSRYHSIAGMTAEARMDYMDKMRRQQIIRETQMYARMGDALLMKSAPGMASALGGTSAAGLHPSTMHAGLQGAALHPSAAGQAYRKVPTTAPPPQDSSSLQTPSSTLAASTKGETTAASN
ncbi:unnamed protein product [Cylindrotheca closterium]|uniref:DUF6824 domain-containing protein n=1 Tax=Cylindrotheca closterium TaxID=2856 RepID=A0AAD2FRM0_9STRA|nr:unnamed protein product [Cylindrotheca closterium]